MDVEDTSKPMFWTPTKVGGRVEDYEAYKEIRLVAVRIQVLTRTSM